MIRTTNIILGLVITAAGILSCQQKNASGRTDTFTSGAITFAADASFAPVIDEVRELFEAVYPNATLTPIYTNESEAIQMLLDGEVWMAITARDFKPEEYEHLKATNQFPQSVKFAYDGLALIANTQNTDSFISVHDIRRILTGEVTQWKQIDPTSNLGEITLVFDNPRSSTVHYAEDSILGGKPITSPHVTAVDSVEQVIKYVEENTGALGILGSNWLNDQRDTTNLTFRREVRPMWVTNIPTANSKNSYLPYQYYFYNDSYPLVRTLYILLNDTHRGLPTGFKNYIISANEGQRVMLRAGLLPAYGNITIRAVHINND